MGSMVWVLFGTPLTICFDVTSGTLVVIERCVDVVFLVSFWGGGWEMEEASRGKHACQHRPLLCPLCIPLAACKP